MTTALVRSEADRPADDEASLIGRARTGDDAAVRILVKRHNRRLYRVARAVLKNDGEAEDVVQETYVRAFTGLASFRGEAAFSTWLTRIAINEALGRARRRRPTVGLESLDTEPERQGASLIMFPSSSAFPSPDAELARRQVRALLEDAIAELPEAFRLVFVLRDVEEMSIEEAADLLGTKPETIKTRLHRARRLLRKALDSRLASAFSELMPFDGARCERMAGRVLQRLSAGSPAG
jgi:RNA polymerase sigma-70 factor (ECF subfamily)